MFRIYHPLTLNDYSNFINAVKRQRNLGLIQRMLILAKSRTWVRATKPISSVDVSRHLQVPQVECHHSVHYICPCVLSSNMFGIHDKIDELDVQHQRPSVLTINIIQGIIGSIKPCFFWCASTRSEQRAVLCLC